MKNYLSVLAVLMLTVILFTACSGKPTDKPDESSAVVTTTPEQTEEPSSTEEPSVIETEEPKSSDVTNVVTGQDASQYNTKENAVPLGEWVYYQEKNYTSGEYEPFYIRIVSVTRDQAEIQTALESYKGYTDFTLTEDQARDIEFGMVEYEIYYAPDYSANEYGITINSVRLNATPIDSVGFKTDGGMSYIGIGGTTSLGVNDSGDRPKPGDTITEKSIFTILNNYDENEYLLRMTWYDGEIVAEKERELYFNIK